MSRVTLIDYHHHIEAIYMLFNRILQAYYIWVKTIKVQELRAILEWHRNINTILGFYFDLIAE